MTRALIIGAGIVGCASALRLAQRGIDVTVIERDRVGEGAASTAAAGILGAQLEAHPVAHMQALCVESRERYAELVREVGELADCHVELSFCGSLRVAFDALELTALGDDVRLQHERNYEAQLLDAAEVAALEPSLSAVAGGALFASDGIVDPRELLRAVHRAATAAGAKFLEGREARALTFDANGEVSGIQLDDGQREADLLILAAGSWSTRIEGVERILAHPTVAPVRGQMLELSCAEQPLRRVVEGPGAYMSPRADGRVLVGSTMERVGFERAVTAGAVARLTSAAIRMVPQLEHATLRGSWCGFRAATPDGLPIFGRVGKLVVATGHFRNGIVLAPITADVVTALALGDAPPIDITAFSIERFDTDGHLS